MVEKQTLTYSLFLSLLLVLRTWANTEDQVYLQVYPPVNDTDDLTDIYFALMLSFGGDYVSIGALPGVQIALDYINSEPSILPGYSLHYTLTDSQCNRSMALESLFKQLSSEHVKLGLVGSGCSVATEPTAEISQFFNIPQVSCVSSSSELKNRNRFRYYFQLLAAESQIAQGFFKIITHYGWKRISLIIQNENLFTVTMDVLKEQLAESGVDFTEKLFNTEDGIDGLSGGIFEPDTRIYVVAMYASHARDFLCKAYYEGIGYPKYLLITYGWYGSEWWTGKASSKNFNCTPEQRSQALAYSLAPRVQEAFTNLTAPDVSGTTAAMYIEHYREAVLMEVNEEINLRSYIPDRSDPFYYAQHCHEATLTLAFALNKTINDLKNNEEQNTTVVVSKNLVENTVFVEKMVKYLQNTSFDGLSGKTVRFDEDGIRQINVLDVYQYQWNNTKIFRANVAVVHVDESLVIHYHQPFSRDSPGMWPDGVPNDGVPIEDVVTVSVGLTVVYVVFAAAGLAFAVVCIFFTLIFRNRKLIRLSSPNLNYLIGLGAIVLYLNIITLVIPTTNTHFAAVLCNVIQFI
ncbi:Gamma-aminobutyric acid type B receptor subunit 1 [Geodia barretti]|uniref:Gamma-aminobutyric acid type B receptor subunit 1 n=1 Tax=Geodia barretti TaxID=519541 RepID=A0AA35W9C4_GEOBA|nr:Gamma-aminobutyric acid type B receptor subunit 1 [Geodia barretti]